MALSVSMKRFVNRKGAENAKTNENELSNKIIGFDQKCPEGVISVGDGAPCQGVGTRHELFD